MRITWQFEIKRVRDENEEIFWSRTFQADTIREAKEKAEDIIREKHSSFQPSPDSRWVVDDESNCISRVYHQRDSRFRSNIDVYHLPKFSAIIMPLDVSLLKIPDYEERMLWEGIY